jgi:quinol monooxygenase YgiN
MKRTLLLAVLTAWVLGFLAPVAWSGGKENPILQLAKEKVADPGKPFTMVVFVTVKDGQGQAFEEAFKPAITATRKEKGCIAYDLNRDLKETSKYYVYERWQSLAALERHFETEHIKTLLSKIGDTLAGPPDAKFYTVVGE